MSKSEQKDAKLLPRFLLGFAAERDRVLFLRVTNQSPSGCLKAMQMYGDNSSADVNTMACCVKTVTFPFYCIYSISTTRQTPEPPRSGLESVFHLILLYLGSIGQEAAGGLR